MGEPLKFGIDGPVEAFLAKRRFSKIENVTSADLKKLYFHGKNGARAISSIYSFAYAVVE